MSNEIKTRHYSRRTLKTHADWARKFQSFLRNKRPEELSERDVKEYLTFFIFENEGNDDFISKQHLSFEVESLTEVTNYLRSIGITEYKLGEVDFFSEGNNKWCEWRDPDGIRLECIELI